MPTNVIPGGYAFSYIGRNAPSTLALHRWTVAISDSLKNRIAKHSYLKRDGSEKEPMGADDGVFRFRLELVGDDCTATYRAIAAYLRKYPRGSLFHPLLGQIQVASEGVDGGEWNAGSVNLVSVALTFSEDALDAAIAVNAIPSPATQQAAVATSTATLTTTASAWSTLASTIALVSTVVTKATAYAQVAIRVYQSGNLTDQLGLLLNGVKSATQALAIALPLDGTIANEARRAQIVIAAEQSYASCLRMQYSILAIRQVAQPFTVQGTMTAGAVASRVFPGTGASRVDQILALNRIPNPYAIPPGTRLKVPPTSNGG